jgi:uncharacterized tellurite resistance protein B-like protein
VVFFENYIERLVTVHHECGKRWNWLGIANKPPPEPPSRDNREQRLVETDLNALECAPTTPLRQHSREQVAMTELENFSSNLKPDAVINFGEIENPEWEVVLHCSPPVMPVRNRNQQTIIESRLVKCVEPKPPERTDLRTFEAQARLDSFSPGILEKMLGKAERQKLSLLRNLEIAREQDESAYQAQYRAYVEQFESWRQDREKLGQALEAARAEDEADYQNAHQSYLRSKAEWTDRHRLAERIVAVKRARLQDNMDFQDACLRYMQELVACEERRNLLLRQLEQAKVNDESTYQQACEAHRQATLDWEERCELARRIAAQDRQVCLEVLEGSTAFSEIAELGSAVTLRLHTARLIEARLTVNLDRLIPRDMKAFTPTGRPTAKPMPKTRYWELASDHVCSCLLRIAREVFALLPADVVLATVVDTQLDASTGHPIETPILSVAMHRESLEVLNFSSLHPFEALANFNHLMDFKKTSGFAPVSELTRDDILATLEPVGRTTEEVAEEAERSVSLLKRLLAEFPAADGCHWIPAGAAARLVSVSQEMKLTIGVCRRVADAIEEAGYCIEPDARYGSGSYNWNQIIGVFKPAEGEPIAPSPVYYGAANLLKLCVLVAAADGRVDKHELGVFRQVIESQLHFGQTELKRLAVLERLLADNSEAVSKIPSKVAKAIPADKRLLVGQVLVKVAAVDHVINKNEYRVLERIFKAFELPPQSLADLMLQVCPVPDEATIQEAKSGSPGETVPQQRVKEKPTGFSLDMSKVYAITNETKEVVGILSVVMDDNQEEALLSSRASKSPQPPISRITEAARNNEASSLARFSGLDPAFRPVLERLLNRDSWSRSEFHALAGEFHLMPLSIHDVINEWADESLGDFLLEGEDPILIRRELVFKEKT